jgi:hypothetical protein
LARHLYSVRLGRASDGPSLDVYDDGSAIYGYGVGQAVDIPADVMQELITELENVLSR